MPGEILQVGDKLHIMTRRLFEHDIRRHFAGQVEAIDGVLALIVGDTFIFNSGVNEYRRLPEKRSRIFSIGDSGNIVNKLPRETDIEQVNYQTIEERLVVTDGGDLFLSINEFGASR